MAYIFSKDYKILFDVICRGESRVAYVDYQLASWEVDLEDKDANCRKCKDLCLVKRHGPYQVTIGVRGCLYGSLLKIQEGDGLEKDLFIELCQKLNLEWIVA